MADAPFDRQAAIQRAEMMQKVEALQAQQAGQQGQADGGETHYLQSIGSGLKTGFQGLQKGLGYAQNLLAMPVLGTAANTVTALQGKPQAFDWSQWGKSLNPTNTTTGPTIDDMMDKMGVPKGKSLSDLLPGLYDPTPAGGEDDNWLKMHKGGALDPSVRGVASTGLSIATDPLTWLLPEAKAGKWLASKFGSKTLESAAEGAGKILSTPSRALGDAGTNMFTSTVAPLIAQGEKAGKTEIADTLFNHGITGPTNKGFWNQMQAATQKLNDQKDAILKSAVDQGSTLNVDQVYKPLQDKLSAMVDRMDITPEDADKFYQQIAMPDVRKGNVPTTYVDSWKTLHQKKPPASAYDPLDTRSSVLADLQQTAGKATRDAVAGAPEVSPELNGVNKDLGNLLTIDDKARTMSHMPSFAVPLGWKDLGAFGAGNFVGGGMRGGLEMLAAEKALQGMFGTPGGRRIMGMGMRTLGTNPWTSLGIDTLTKEALKPPGNRNQ